MTLNTAQRLALNLDSHIAIDAGAGTGKTSTIVERVIEHYLTEDQRATRILPRPERPGRLQGGLLVSPMSERIDLNDWGGLLPGEVVLLTFTNLAADEMRDRLRHRIAQLRFGSYSSDKDDQSDPRIRHEGFPEQLLMLLEDAPIGTIDSFFNQLVTPYRSLLGDTLGHDVVTEAGRIRIIEAGINTLWRLPRAANLLGDAVDAGVPADDVEAVLAARDRIARHFAGRKKSARMLRNLIDNSVFIGEGERGLLNATNRVDPELLRARLMESIRSQDIDEFTGRLGNSISDYCEVIRNHISHFAATGWASETRMASLVELADDGRPADDWERLVWAGQVLMCTVSSKLLKPDPTIFPSHKLPNDQQWPAGIEPWSTIKANATKIAVRDQIHICTNAVKDLLVSPLGQRVLHHTQLAMILEATPGAHAPPDHASLLRHLPEPLPERLNGGLRAATSGFTLTAEARNLDDLRIVLRGLKGIVKMLKEREEVHEFDDITRLAGDLLLAKCPDICRTFYPRRIIDALDSIPDEAWRDDHIHRAFRALEALEADPLSAAESADVLGEIRADLERRLALLKQIRRRYRAFIIDEAQDNSPLQWRLLSRLWGPREIRTDEVEEPDTDWQPTICYVGDMKQSIYAFRQAEVAGFRLYANRLRRINEAEFQNIPVLTRAPELRREDASRDPRYSHLLQILRGSELADARARNITDWIPFDSNDGTVILDADEVTARTQGLISLRINYRTQGGLLRVMNEWWEDVFDERHRFFSDADYYAEAQQLIPQPSKQKNSGTLEWICPVRDGGESDPPRELTTYLDPFGPGKPDSTERQAMMIAMRIRALHDGTSTRVRGADGEWRVIQTVEKVEYGDIMILMASRGNLRDTMIRHLHDLGIPAQADREGGLLRRPAAAELDGLLQLIARPRSRHAAAWVARSSLIGMNDDELQRYLSADDEDDLLTRLSRYTTSQRQANLVARWIQLAAADRLIEILEETIDQSDLLTAHHDHVSAQDVEQFVDVVRQLAAEVGGDPIVIADRIRDLREQKGRALEAKTVPPCEAVRVMTIHGAKGLQSKVVIIADLFSDKQVSMTIEDNQRLIVSPEFFASHPAPWAGLDTPLSAMWRHTRRIHMARKDAEARRLLYVAATRAKDHLIVVGSPPKTKWSEDGGLELPWGYTPTKIQLGQMWAESLRQGSWRRGEANSPWSQDGDAAAVEQLMPAKGETRLLDPAALQIEGHLGGGSILPGITVYHHPDCLIDDEANTETPFTPLQKHVRFDLQAHAVAQISPTAQPRSDSGARLQLAPHRLSNIDRCPRRHWFETRGGLRPDPISHERPLGDEDWDERGEDDAEDGANLPTPSQMGLMVHRILEIGIGNSGPTGEEPTRPLPETWTRRSTSRLLDEALIDEVFEELLPKGVDEDATREIVRTMLERIEAGPVGILSRGEEFEGNRVEGLRTEYPFTISNAVELGTLERNRWTPDGLEALARIDTATVDMDGSIDLILCSVSESNSTVRAVDLKTEQARSILDGNGRLIKTLGKTGSAPASKAETEMLLHHRLQLALYHRALERMESQRPQNERREVVRPAILVGVTGRLVEYPAEMFDSAQSELDTVLQTAARMALTTESPLSEFERRPAEEAQICKTCPFNQGAIPICGPQDE